MLDRIDWETLQAILTIIFAFVNIIFVFFLLRENIKLRKVETEPELSIYLQQNPSLSNVYDIVVKNIGKGAAYNLTFEFDKDAELIGRQEFRKLYELGFFQGVKYLAPNQEYKSLFGGHAIFRDPLPRPLEIKVKYSNKKRKDYSDPFTIDPSDYWGTNYFTEKTANDISKDLDKISTEIRRISNQLDKYSGTDSPEVVIEE